MNYSIDTGLILQKFNGDGCPICEIKQNLEEKILFEFLNDAVMDDDTRIRVGQIGFCKTHYDMLFERQNKLSVALQIQTYNKVTVDKLIQTPTSYKQAKKISEKIKENTPKCAVCEILDSLMIRYYKAIAKMFITNKNFYKSILSCKGFCMEHYAELLKYSNSAGYLTKNYLMALSTAQKNSLNYINENLQYFCNKHDYRNSLNPLGSSEDCLINTREKLFGKKYK